MLDAIKDQLCSKLCWHNRPGPNCVCLCVYAINRSVRSHVMNRCLANLYAGFFTTCILAHVHGLSCGWFIRYVFYYFNYFAFLS